MNYSKLLIISILTIFLLLPALHAGGADVRLVFWFDRARPLDTFKFQAYDLRRKEFTPDVDRWLAVMKKDFPGYDAYTRDVDLAGERGETDNLKVGSAVLREFLVLGGRYGYDFGGYDYQAPARPVPFHSLPRVGTRPAYTGVPSASYPFPVPYPRPHP
jgi:hypothetical protein